MKLQPPPARRESRALTPLLLSLLLLLGGGPSSGGQTPAPDSTRSMTTSPDAPGPLYDVRGIFDPGLNGMIAMAIKVPRGWRMEQSFIRQWNGAAPVNMIYVGLGSPDGHDTIEYLPEMLYHYSDGPAERGLQQWMAQHGQRDAMRIAPLLPVDYLKRVFLPLLAQKANLHVRITGEDSTPPKPVGAGLQTAAGSVDGVLPSGRRMRFQTRINLMSGNPTGYTLYSWGASTTVMQSDTDLAACLAHAEVVQGSVATNPAWRSQDEQLKQRGLQMNQQQAMANLEASRRRFEQNVQMQQQQRAAINRNYENHRRATSRVSSAFADYLGDRARYENPDTGERVKVQSGYSHVYQDGQGTTFGTNAPLEANRVDWQELQQVEVKNY